MAGKTYIKTGSASWSRIKKIYLKEGATTWRAIRKAYIKTDTGWKKVFDTASNRPYLANGDRPRIRLNSYRSTGYIEAEPVQQMGPPYTNPTYGWPIGTVGDYLWGADAGTLSNWVSGGGSAMTSSYQWLYSTSADKNTQIPINLTSISPTSTTVPSGEPTDKFKNNSTYLGSYDNCYIWFKPTYTNASGSTSAVSNGVLIIKQVPTSNYFYISSPATGVTLNQAVTITWSIQDYWYNSVSYTKSRIEWYLESSNTSQLFDSTTRVKTDYLYLTPYTFGTNEMYGTSTYTPTTAAGANGKYLYARLILVNSYTDYLYGTDVGTATNTVYRGPVNAPPAIDTYPSITKLDSYLTIPASGLYTNDTTDGTAYTQSRLRGNNGLYTPNPTAVDSVFQYSSDQTNWSTFYDSSGFYQSYQDTAENTTHDYYLEDKFYTTSSGLIPNNTSNQVDVVGKYIRFGSNAYNGAAATGYNYAQVGPIYDYTTAPGNPVINYKSGYDATRNYIEAYWSAATKIGTYSLQIYQNNAWITLATSTTTPTSTSKLTNILAPIGVYNFRVINKNVDGVYAKSSTVSFDTTVPPGDISNVKNYNFSGTNAHLFLTTGTNTTQVKYKFSCTSFTFFPGGEFTQNVSSSTPYQFIHNLLSYFNQKSYAVDTYSPSTTYKLGNTVWYAGNQYQVVSSIYSSTYPYNEIGFSGIVPTNTAYWSPIVTNYYYAGDYVNYQNTWYFCKQATTATYPTNTTYWLAYNVAFVTIATPYNGTKAGNTFTGTSTVIINPTGNTDVVAVSLGPTFSNVAQTSFTTKYTPSVYTNEITYDLTKAGTSVTGYPYTQSVSGAVEYTDNASSLTANTDYTVNIVPRYIYVKNASFNVSYTGTTKSGTQKTLATSPNAFNFTISKAGSVTTPGTPSITRVSSTSNTVLFELGSSFPTDTAYYGVNQSGAAFGTRTGTPAQTVTTLNQWNSSGNYSATGGTGYTYDTISTIDSTATTSSAMTISTTGYGKTRAANANVSTTTGASSWAINFSYYGADANSVTTFSDGTGTARSSGGTVGTPVTVTVYTNSMPVKLLEITGASDPVVTINSMIAYSGTGQTGSTTSGTAGTTTSLTIGRPTSTSSETTQNYIYYTAPTYKVTYSGNGNTGGSVPTDSTSYANGDTVTVKSNSGSLTKTGYTFNGWNTASDGTGTSYAATGSATFTISANVTLYAKWTATVTNVGNNKPQGAPSIVYDSANSTSTQWAYDVTITKSTIGVPDPSYYLQWFGNGSTSSYVTQTGPYTDAGLGGSFTVQNVLVPKTYTLYGCQAWAMNGISGQDVSNTAMSNVQ